VPERLGSGKVLTTRRGTIAVAAVAALIALALLLVFLSNYRDSVSSGDSTDVLVADQLIDENTSGDVIAEADLFRSETITEDDAVDGAFTDVGELRGLVATADIYPGEQLSSADFQSGDDPVAGRLEGIQRAIAVPVDTAHGNIEQIEAGTRVDVLGGFDAEVSGDTARPITDVLARDVMIMKTPEVEDSAGGDDETEVVLRVSDIEASRIAFVADHGDVWLTIRPPTLAKESSISSITGG
jgi:Flp pilus assembly protein CpaB